MSGKPYETREPSGTDHKTRTADEHIHEEDKQHLHARPGKKVAIPKKGENPALDALKARRRNAGNKG